MASGRSGLGHLRRVSTIARALRAIAPDAPTELLTNAPPDGLEPDDLAAYDSITLCERQDMSARLSQSDTALAVFDTILVPGVEKINAKLALILRETPDELAEGFRLPGGRLWDRVLVPNPKECWLPHADLIGAKNVRPVGWIYRLAMPSAKGTNGLLQILVATGGGGKPETVGMLYPRIDAVLTRARLAAACDVSVRQAIGPRARGLGSLRNADDIFDPGSALNRWFAEAGIVISTAGYNSVLELARTDTPTLLVPIPRTFDDQAARARLWGAKLGAYFDPEAPDHAIDWLVDRINRPRRRPVVDLGPSGEPLAAQSLLDLLQ